MEELTLIQQFVRDMDAKDAVDRILASMMPLSEAITMARKDTKHSSIRTVVTDTFNTLAMANLHDVDIRYELRYQLPLNPRAQAVGTKEELFNAIKQGEDAIWNHVQHHRIDKDMEAFLYAEALPMELSFIDIRGHIPCITQELMLHVTDMRNSPLVADNTPGAVTTLDIVYIANITNINLF